MTLYESFFTKGFCVIPNSNFIKNFLGNEDCYIKNCELFESNDFEDYIPKDIFLILKKTQSEIAEQHIVKVFNSYISSHVGIWEGVDSGSQRWHNDRNEGKGVDCNFLLYFDDMFVDGALHVKGPLGEETIYPKRDMLIWLNQSEKFLHKADKSNNKRRLASFEFILPEMR